MELESEIGTTKIKAFSIYHLTCNRGSSPTVKEGCRAFRLLARQQSPP